MLKRDIKSEEMFKLVMELESTGCDRQSFARLHGVSLSKLDYWRHLYHHQNRDRTSGFIELKGAPVDLSMEIVYPNGVTIRLSGDCGPIRLRELVTLL